MSEKTADKTYPSQFEKVKEITNKLEAGIKALFESEAFKKYLSTVAKFHNYSLNNTILIAMQRPDSTYVAGYTAWKNQFGRQVQKGEIGIKILAPTPYKKQMEVDKVDPSTGQKVMNPDGTAAKELKEIMVPAFKVVNVWDVRQTAGKPLPTIGVDELTGNVHQYEMFFEALKRSCRVPIGFEQIGSGAKGYYHTVDHRIALQEGMSEVQTIKTLIHEMTHQALHAKDPRELPPDEPRLTRNAKEVEAEAVAYTVAQHYGIETSDYSFAYIAGWSHDKDTPELKASLDRIRKTADELITGIDEQLALIRKEKITEMVSEAEILAVKLDDLSYEFDYYGYADAVDDREAAVRQNKESLLENGADVEAILEFLQEIVDDDGEYSLRAAELMTEIRAFSEKADALMPKEAELPEEPVPALQENGQYRYYSTQRPVDLGTFPKPSDNPVMEIHNYDTDRRLPVEGARFEAWGYVEYQKPLTEKEASAYELKPAPARLTESQVAEIRKQDMQPGKLVLTASELDIDGTSGSRRSSKRKSVLKDLETKKPQHQEAKPIQKKKKPKEETR